MDSRTVDVDGVGLHVGVTGDGPDVLVLSGGPGCVHYLEDDALAPRGFRSFHPEPRGVGRSGGGPHDMERAVADLEAVREALGVERWVVLGHSWGSDLAVRYAVEHPGAVRAVVGIAGHGLHSDRTWSAAYEAGKAREPAVDVAFDEGVWVSLRESFAGWIHEPDLWRSLADCPVPMRFLAAEDDVRPSWPLQQLAALVPHGAFSVVPGVPHDFWSTHPDVWVRTVSRACASTGDGRTGFRTALEALVARHEVRVDRPRGTAHPRHPDVVYPLDYGYLVGTTTTDGAGIDVFCGSDRGAGLVGAYLTVDARKGDIEVKVLLDCTPDEVDVVGRFLAEALRLSPLLVDG